MFDKLEGVEARYEELTKLISDPEVIANQAECQKRWVAIILKPVLYRSDILCFADHLS